MYTSEPGLRSSDVDPDRTVGPLKPHLRRFPIAQPWLRPTPGSATNCRSPVLESSSQIYRIVILCSRSANTNRKWRQCENPKMHVNDCGGVFPFHPACLCPNSFENSTARQMRVTDEETMSRDEGVGWSARRPPTSTRVAAGEPGDRDAMSKEQTRLRRPPRLATAQAGIRTPTAKHDM